MAPAAKRRKTVAGSQDAVENIAPKSSNTRSQKPSSLSQVSSVPMYSPAPRVTRATRSTTAAEVKPVAPMANRTPRPKAASKVPKAPKKISTSSCSPSTVTASSKVKTPTKSSTASQYLKDSDWNVNTAVDAYFSSQATPSTKSPGLQDKAAASLNAIFDQYRDGGPESPDTMGVEGAQKYFGDLDVDLESAAVLVVSELLQSQEFASFTRSGFVEGWKRIHATSVALQRAAIPRLTTAIASDANAFKRVYRFTFNLAKPAGQRAVPLDVAIAMWTTLFTPPGTPWNTRKMHWLDLWTDYLNEKWKKTVNKDMWNMTGEFQRKTVELDRAGLDNWDMNGTWPVVIDEFVVWVKEKHQRDSIPMEID